jgi:hypothetical protein
MAVSWYVPGETEETHENICRNNRSPSCWEVPNTKQYQHAVHLDITLLVSYLVMSALNDDQQVMQTFVECLRSTAWWGESIVSYATCPSAPLISSKHLSLSQIQLVRQMTQERTFLCTCQCANILHTTEQAEIWRLTALPCYQFMLLCTRLSSSWPSG